MKKKINRMFVMISVLAILLTTVLITVVYHGLFRTQVAADIKDCAVLLRQCTDMGQLEEMGEVLEEQELRVTLIDGTGKVLYDNEVSGSELENHLGRPEIREAMETGEGQAVRNSSTLSRNTFYYAVRLDNGDVLRVAKDAGSIYNMFGSVVPTIIWILAALILLSLGMAYFLTQKLIVPIERLAENMGDNVDYGGYEELFPFITMIQKQHQDIVKSARIRQEFTANVSHELKTPLTAISGYAELIENGMASEEDVTRFAHGIHSSANRLLTLINDIIRLSELDSGENETPFENLNLYELADTCVEMLAMNAEKHGVKISMSGEECHINGNRQMVEELLYNLCDNAIRYNNPGGSVEVSVTTVHDRETGEEKGVLSVKDTGIGIPKEHQERIFERFYRVDKSRSKSTGGTGLGLAIVKHIVEKHGAEIKLDSKVGEGTDIRILFPLCCPGEQPQTPQSAREE